MIDMVVVGMLITCGIIVAVICAVISYISENDGNKKLAKYSYAASMTFLTTSCLAVVWIAVTIIIHLMMR